MKLSVVIPCYNEVDLAQQVVDSVIDAPGPEKEIIIVDDGSTDGTRQLPEEHVKREKFATAFATVRCPH